MLSLQTKIAQSLLLLTVLPTVIACSKSKFTATQAQPVAPVEQTNNPRTQPPTYSPTPSQPTYDCRRNNTCQQPQPNYPNNPRTQSECQDYNYEYSNNGPKTVHVWVVMDGSKSNENERYNQLKGLIEMYENTIAREIPIHLGVITGHSAESYHSALRGNNFFKYASEDLDVLRFDHTETTRRNNLIRLKNKILHMQTDNSRGISDGGELLTANLMAVLKNNQYRTLMRMQDKDILNIHFIGDENDACTVGEVPSTLPIYAPIRSDERGMTSEQIARKRHCVQDVTNYSINMNVSDGGRGYSQTLAQELISLSQHFNMHMSAFVYTGENGVPAGGQNEIGRGIIDLLGALGQNNVNSKVFDLASLSTTTAYSTAEASASISAAGASIAEGMNSSLYQRVQIKDANGRAVELNAANVEAVTVDGRRVEHRVEQGGYVRLVRGCPREGNKITVRYCNRGSR